MDARLLDILVCPLCKSNLEYGKADEKNSVPELICKPCRLAFPVRDDIPIMLEDEARRIEDPA